MLGLGLKLGLVDRLLSVSGITTTQFDFTSSLPVGWSATRSGTTATYTDSNGDLQQASANTARIDHNSAGDPLGVLIENTAENKVTAANINPSTTTGITIVSGTGTVSVVDKTSEVALSGLDGILTNGNVYEIEETAGGTLVVQLSDTVGNTNKHSYIAYAWSEGGTTQLDLVGVGAQTVAVGTQPVKYEAEDLTPSATTRYLRAIVTNSRKMFVILMHLEEAAENSSIIVSSSSGSTKTRNRDEIRFDDLDGEEWFNQTQGAIIALTRPQRLFQGIEQGYFLASVLGASANNRIGVRSLSSSTSRLAGNYVSGGASQFNESVGIPLQDDLFATGIVYKPDELSVFASHGMRFVRDTSITPIATTLDTLWLGRTNQFFGYMYGHVSAVYVLSGDASYTDVGGAFLTSTNTGVACAGQSNMEGWSEVEGVYTNGGEKAAIEELNNYYTTGRNYISNMAIGGSALYARNNATNHWLENDGVTAGRLLNESIEAHKAMNAHSNLIGFLWNQGETDVSAESKSSLKDGWKKVFDIWRSSVAELPVFIIPPARRSDSASGDPFYDNWRDAIQELADENDWIHLTPNTMINPMVDETGVSDSVHLSDAGNAANAPLVIRKVASVSGETVTGAVDGSEITGVVRVGTMVTVTVTHPAGITDFTPTTGIEGFKFEDDGAEISVLSAVRTNATTITLTLNSTPTGVEVLKYCYGTGFGLDPANLVRGNDSYTIPMQSYKGAL